MAETDLSLIGNRTWDAERLKTDTESFGSFCGVSATFLYSDCRADGVSPNGVFKTNGLNAADDSVNVNAFVKRNFFAFFNIFNAVFGETLIDLIDSSFVSFKSNSHNIQYLPN